MPKFTRHIFICMNQREPGHPRGCCDPAGQGELQRCSKSSWRCVASSWSAPTSPAVSTNASSVPPSRSTLKVCGVHPEEADEIIESHIVNDRPAERLRIPDEILNTTHKKRD